ncbi:MAG: GNAT family protein [Patescibacteria group bacterium]
METNFRKLTIEDLPHRIKWLNDPEINKHLGTRVRTGTDEEFHKKWFECYFSDDFREIFTIEVDGKPVGQVGLLDINPLDKNGCLYIIIGEKNYWGKGIGSQAMEFILNYGFDTLGLHKIWLEVYASNSAAIKLYKKFGFNNEGIYKDQVLYPDGFVDEIRMAKFQN